MENGIKDARCDCDLISPAQHYKSRRVVAAQPEHYACAAGRRSQYLHHFILFSLWATNSALKKKRR
jgi:hypothetical protein